MWFDKEHSDTLYIDIREVDPGTSAHRPNWSVEPDMVADYRNLPFKDEKFELIVWDIPHKIKHDSGQICLKYSFLGENWEEDTAQGFKEVWRCLKPGGVLIFKWNDLDVKVSEMLALFDREPLFGTRTKKGVNNTYWILFKKHLSEKKPKKRPGAQKSLF
jgi:SAM-dependent methyltransferase